MDKLIKAAKAISDKSRIRMLNLLLQRECCVCEVMKVLNISQTRASRNLSILHKVGFLKARKQGLWVYYSIDKNELNDCLLSLLQSVEKGLTNSKEAQIDVEQLKDADKLNAICCKE